MVEGTRLEIERPPLKRFVGSNPTPSANWVYSGDMVYSSFRQRERYSPFKRRRCEVAIAFIRSGDTPQDFAIFRQPDTASST